jgi:Fe-S-cluster containining protein
MNGKMIRIYKQNELRFVERGYKAAVAPIYEDLDVAFASVDGAACTKGCSSCCRLYVEVLPPEIAIIIDYVRNNFPPALRAEILEKLRRNSVEENLRDKADYRQANLPCAFLNEDNGECRVYDVRPITCRSFGSTNVNVCDLIEPDDGMTTFRVAPQSLLMLVASSGLFWTGMHEAALAYWMGLPVEVVVSEDQVNTVMSLRAALDKAKRDGTPVQFGIVPSE